MIAIDGLVATDLGILEPIGFLLGGEQLRVLSQGSLIALQGEHVIGLLGEDLRGDVALASHRVDGDDRPLDR